MKKNIHMLIELLYYLQHQTIQKLIFQYKWKAGSQLRF